MSRQVKLAACQFRMRAVRDLDEFAAHVVGLLDEAAGADLVLFPELFTLELFTTIPGWNHLPVSEISRIVSFTDVFEALFLSEARKRSQYIAAGSHLTDGEDGGYRNTAYLFGEEGIIARHAKTHVFPLERLCDTEEGDDMSVITLPFGRVGFNICYEIEFPECAATLTEQGAEIILCPSLTLAEHGFWRVRHCAHARCIENQVFVVQSCGCGDPGAPLPTGYGRSAILGPSDLPWRPGGVLVEAPPNREVVISTTVDLDELQGNRETGAAPTYRDRRRRSGVYRTWPSHETSAEYPADE